MATLEPKPAFTAAELLAMKRIAEGKVHVAYLNDPLVVGLLDLKLVAKVGSFLGITPLGATILWAADDQVHWGSGNARPASVRQTG